MFDTNNLTADPEDANAEPQGGMLVGLVGTSTRTVLHSTGVKIGAGRC